MKQLYRRIVVLFLLEKIFKKKEGKLCLNDIVTLKRHSGYCADCNLIVALRAWSCALRIHLSLFIIIWYWKAQTNFIIILQMMWIIHFLKVTQFLFEFKRNRKFNLLKALSALRNTFSSWRSRFALDFLCTFQ